MKRLSVFLIAILLCAVFTACQQGNAPSENKPSENVPTEPQTAEMPPETDESTNSGQEDNSINDRLISLIGQPLSNFTEEFGFQLEDLKIFSQGPPVGEYTIGDTTYVFNNYLGYDDLTKNTPCTEIRTKYTEILPGIEQGSLTEDRLIGLFGQHTEEYGDEKVYQYNGVNIFFKTNADGHYDDFVRMSNAWGSEQLN